MFLSDIELRPVSVKETRGFEIIGLGLGRGSQALEILVTRSARRPSQADIKAVWRSRLGGRVSPLLLVVLHSFDQAAICGPAGDDPVALPELEAARVERICRTALDEPDRHSALRFLRTAISEVDSPLAGLRNEGLFATHELVNGVSQRPDWKSAVGASAKIMTKRRNELFTGLGYSIEPLPGPASILRAAKTKIAVAVLLERDESPDISSARFSDLSPISYALAKADEENLPYVMISAGPALRIYPVKSGIGTGRRGRTETFLELHLDLIEENQAGFLWLLFSASALSPDGSFSQILARSGDFAVGLGERLRDRVYEGVIPHLAEAVLDARRLVQPTCDELGQTYEMALLILFRLLFIAYAEDKDLLPYRHNELYRTRSLKQKSRELLKLVESGQPFDRSTSHWDDCLALFRAVDEGKGEWGIPSYDGGLFSSDADINRAGNLVAGLRMPNAAFGPALAELLLDDSPEGRGPVDFRSLGVREFGTIYEGLLENDLSIAEMDLAVGKDGKYRPAKAKDAVIVQAGAAYLHNASGARKSTGSFFTKDFAVEHLLDHALEPALEDHIRRLDCLKDERAAASSFFDFRAADLAMGSGHFLVAAVDRIERRLSSYMARRPLPDIMAEMRRLRNKAMEALGSLSEGVEIEDTQLLRRQIARHSIFGVDINPLAVELARLSIWVHTFVPGLPLSFLDHNLICGNSLVGMATVDEAEELLKKLAGPLYSLSIEQLIGGTKGAMEKLARLSDADAAEISAAREAFGEAGKAAAPAEALFDILAAARIDVDMKRIVHTLASHWVKDLSDVPASDECARARKILGEMCPIHFPVAFPEVFLRIRTGFDVILGNPPWEEATVEEDRFWTRYFPGFHSLPQQEQEAEKKKLRRSRPDLVAAYEEEVVRAEKQRKVLVSGPFPGMGIGDPDLYKAFAWRFMALAASEGGRIGVVLPRSAFSAKGSMEFRKEIFIKDTIDDITVLQNKGGWVFDDAEHRYSIVLLSVSKKQGKEEKIIPFRGPYSDVGNYVWHVKEESEKYAVKEVMSWTDTGALPLLPDSCSGEIFTQLRKSPRLDMPDGAWIARPTAELHATNDKKYMILSKECPKGCWPIFKGESFDIWKADTGKYYAWGDPDVLLPHLCAKRFRARNAFSGFSRQWLNDSNTLPCLSARIAFRDVSRATDSRTFRAALIPPKVYLTNKAPYFLWPNGDEKDEAFLLGILCSIPLDWYARRFVELDMNFFILNPFPIPRPERSSGIWQRIVQITGRLSCPDQRFASWAKEVGVDCGAVQEDEKEDLICEIDALSALLYGLSAGQLTQIFRTFHEGWDYEERLRNALKQYVTWRTRL